MALEELRVVPIDEPTTVFRAVAIDDRRSSDFVDSFKSSDVLGIPPRNGSPEERFCLIHNGISCFMARRPAEKIAQRWGKGDFIAELLLEPGHGICLAEWGSKDHVTVWGDPVKLASMTVDITAVQEH